MNLFLTREVSKFAGFSYSNLAVFIPSKRCSKSLTVAFVPMQLLESILI